MGKGHIARVQSYGLLLHFFPQIHPIFQLSVADWLQGLFWIIGACLWFRGTSDLRGCYIVSVCTVVRMASVILYSPITGKGCDSCEATEYSEVDKHCM